jgi:hypothetical protein
VTVTEDQTLFLSSQIHPIFKSQNNKNGYSISHRKDIDVYMRRVFRDTCLGSLGHHSDWCAVTYPSSDSTWEGAEAQPTLPLHTHSCHCHLEDPAVPQLDKENKVEFGQYGGPQPSQNRRSGPGY